MVIEGAEKQAGRLWDKFGLKEVGVGHHHKAMACFCHMQEGMHHMDVGRRHQRLRGGTTEFEWWDTKRARRARRKTFSIVSVAANALASTACV